MRMKTFSAFLILFLPPAFAETITYSCEYSNYSNPEGPHKAKEKFEMTFIVDKVTGKAYLHGNNGVAEVEFFSSDGNVSFLEITPSGNLMTTAIGGNLTSVHSRNTVMSGELLPSQYYGKCNIIK